MIASEARVGFERMRVSVVSDIHGNIEDLARVAGAAEQLVVLGDLLDYIDYHDSNGGIFGAGVWAGRSGTYGTFASGR